MALRRVHLDGGAELAVRIDGHGPDLLLVTGLRRHGGLGARRRAARDAVFIQAIFS